MANRLTINNVRAQIANQGLSPSHIVSSCIDAIRNTNSSSNAYTTVLENSALERAATLSSVNSDKPLLGAVLAVKDNFCVANVRTTAASRMLSTFTPTYTATVVQRLVDAGCIVIGKTMMDEFGMGNTTSNSSLFSRSLFRGKTPGGSSGGSAAAVALNTCHIALGSDTGGSVRQPAAVCGIVGFKPSYGAFSRFGLIPYASSLDCPGVLSRSVDDTIAASNVLFGADPRDSSSVNVSALSLFSSKDSLRGLRIGIPSEYFFDELSSDMKSDWEAAATQLEAQGASLVSVSIPSIKNMLHAYYIIAPAEASSNLSRYSGLFFGTREKDLPATRSLGFGREVQRRILAGTFALSRGAYEKYYGPAQQVRRMVAQDYAHAFEQCDFILSPVLPSRHLNENPQTASEGYIEDVYTVGPSLAGLPAISVPVFGVGRGMQLIGRFGGDRDLLQLSKMWESVSFAQS